ncbi:MAG: dethiobiotin synthase [Candidatus Saganbacteria bacterium]|nr:dethiobiotin synthase [Candidatus Saganbacteria bacterium]
MKHVFVCGTDTGVGKTVVTGLLARSLLEQGYSVITQKWVQTGSKKPLDIEEHLRIMGIKKKDVKKVIGLMCPYIFKFPASPHLAARAEGKKADDRQIKQSFKKLAKMFDRVIVEGIGGALVPLNEKALMIDLVKKLEMPVVLVVPNRLGSINQALLTIEALKQRKIKILAVVFNDHFGKGQNKKVLNENVRMVQKISGVKCVRLKTNKRPMRDIAAII